MDLNKLGNTRNTVTICIVGIEKDMLPPNIGTLLKAKLLTCKVDESQMVDDTEISLNTAYNKLVSNS